MEQGLEKQNGILALKEEYEKEIHYLNLQIKHDTQHKSLHSFIPSLIEGRSVYQRVVKDLEVLLK